MAGEARAGEARGYRTGVREARGYRTYAEETRVEILEDKRFSF